MIHRRRLPHAERTGRFFTFCIFLFYGLVFFTTGVAIASKVTRGSKLKIARYLPLFAIFAFVHAFHEWLVLFLFLEWPALPKDILPIISRARLVPIVIWSAQAWTGPGFRAQVRRGRSVKLT